MYPAAVRGRQVCHLREDLAPLKPAKTVPNHAAACPAQHLHAILNGTVVIR
jgi:hypothetical protein